MKFLPSRWFDPMPALLPAMALVLVLTGWFVGTVRAQPAPVPDPPGRVARLADSSGQVWLYSPDVGEWITAVRNRPLTTGDWLATDAGARAELQVGSTTVRLDGGTELEVRTLDDEHIALQLHSGSVAARLRDGAEAAQFEVNTDDGRFLVQRVGRYRFDRVRSASFVTVHAGTARYEGPNSGLTIPVGQRAEFWIDAAGAAQYRLSEPQSDAFAAWNGERDRERDRFAERATDRTATTPYVSRAMTGAEDLDRYGRWEQDPEQGALWIPRDVAADWAPYSTGHWAWVRPWGWTWIDDAPWGFAPFHYGRWVYVRNTWCWAPGRWVARPVYAPALVGWVGGPGASVSISIGGGRPPAPVVGWFPLAPREVFVPGYRTSPGYVRNINITNVTNVTQITNVINSPQAPRDFDNRRVQHAVTVVPVAVMTSRQPVAPAASQLRDTPWVRDIGKQPAGGTVLVSAPVTAPNVAVRGPDMRVGTPPPGTGQVPGGPPVDARPGMPPRDHDRDGARRTPPVPAVQTAPVAGPAPAPAAATTAATTTATTTAIAAPMARPVPDATALRPVGPPQSTLVNPAVAGEKGERAAPPQAGQEAPIMRSLPVYRGEDRRPPPRPQTPATVEARPTAAEVAPPPRPAEGARPAAPPAVPAAHAATRPAEPAKVAPAEVKKGDAPPRPHGETPKEPREDKRGEPKERDTR